MIEINIPGGSERRLAHLVCDYNGTLAVAGQLLSGVDERLRALAERIEIHVVTADTFGEARNALAGLPVLLNVLDGTQPLDMSKRGYVRKLGSAGVAALGNGRNDRLLVREATLGIAVLEAEGACFETLAAADLVCRCAADALDLLLDPRRVVAGLRL